MSYRSAFYFRSRKSPFNTFIPLLLIFLLAAGSARAAQGGGGLPWEAPLTTLGNSITGPVAFYLSLLGMVGAGGTLIFSGGHVNEFMRVVIYIVLVIGMIIVAKNTMTGLGFTAGSEIFHHATAHNHS